MKKIFILIFLSLIFAGCQRCKLEREKTHQIAIPIIAALAKYAQTNGIPKFLLDVKNIPYKLEPCSKKPDVLACEVLKNGYYFKKNNKYVSVRLYYYAKDKNIKNFDTITYNWNPHRYDIYAFGVEINYNTTVCMYDIFSIKNGLEKNFQPTTCSMIGSCRAWGRQ